jgi:putative phage-type endonuclease
MALTAEQLEFRKSGVGGSDVATILGLNPYKTQFELYMEKTGQVEPENLDDNDAVAFGNIIENTIGEFYTHKTGVKLRNKLQTIRSEKYPWLVANIDKKVEGQRKGVEIKNVGSHAAHAWGKDGTDEVAEYYMPQPMHYMLVLDYEAWDVAAYFGGAELKIYPLFRDKEFDELIIDITHDFWHNNVIARVPPDIDYDHASTEGLLKRINAGTDGSERNISEIEHWHRVRLDAAAKAKEYEAIASGAKNHILEAIGGAAVGVIDGAGSYNRKLVKRKGFTVEPSEYMNMTFKKEK